MKEMRSSILDAMSKTHKTIVTDGSAIVNDDNKDESYYGFALFDNKTLLHKDSGYLGYNIKAGCWAEVQASIKAIEYINNNFGKEETIVLMTDNSKSYTLLNDQPYLKHIEPNIIIEKVRRGRVTFADQLCDIAKDDDKKVEEPSFISDLYPNNVGNIDLT